MKQLFVLCLGLLMMTASQAQKKGDALLYGYKQVVLPGMVPSGIIDEKGREVNPAPKAKFNFFIYLAGNKNLMPLKVIINGTAYKVTAVQVSTPVKNNNYPFPKSPKLSELVPATHLKVWQLQLAGLNSESEKISNEIIAANELIVIYSQKHKEYYTALKKMTPLEPAAMQ